MISIYICEDNLIQRSEINRHIENIIFDLDLDMSIILSSDKPRDIIDRLKDDAGFGIYFLDITLNAEINGLELAQEIRKYDRNGFIIFVTTHEEMSHLTFQYKVEALDYIVKNDENLKSRLKECLISIKDKCSNTKMSKNKRSNCFHIDNKSKSIFLPHNEIKFFETSHKAHKVIVHTIQKQIEFYGNLGKIAETLDDRFLRCHKSIIVNKELIKEVDKTNRRIVFEDGDTCEVSFRLLNMVIKLL